MRCVVLFVQINVIPELDFFFVLRQMFVKYVLKIPEKGPCHRV